MKVSEDFNCQLFKHGDELLVSLQGDLDMYTCSNLEKVLWGALSPEIEKVTIDCDGVQYVDSSFLQLLVRLSTQVTTVRVMNASRTIRKIFDITGLTDTFIESEA